MHHVLIRLLSFLRPYKGRALLAAFCVFSSAAFVLVTPKLIGWAVELGITGQDDRRLLIVAAVAVLGSSVFRGISQYGQQYTGEWLSQHVAFDIRNAIYDRLQRLSYAYHDKAQIGQIMSRATADVEGVRMYVSMGLLRLTYTITLLIVALTLMAQANLRLALISWSFLPVIAIASIVTQMKLRPIWLRVQDQQGRMSTVLQENLSGMRVVKSFAREAFESAKFWKEITKLFDDSYYTNRMQAFTSPLINGLGSLALVATVWVGGHDVAHGRMSVGELTAFVF